MTAELDKFTRAYIECALWSSSIGPGHDCPEDTSLESAGYGVDDLSAATLTDIVADCARFQQEHAIMLALAGNDDQNGHDYWLTRNRHGAGFWDRGYPRELGQALTEAAHAEGSRELYIGDDGRVYQS